MSYKSRGDQICEKLLDNKIRNEILRGNDTEELYENEGLHSFLGLLKMKGFNNTKEFREIKVEE